VRQESVLAEAFSKLQERLESQEAEREAEREEHRRQMEEMMKAREADREALRQEFMAMMQATHVQASIQQVIVSYKPCIIFVVSNSTHDFSDQN